METQTTFQQRSDLQRSEICPFRVEMHEDLCEYATANTYEEFLTILKKVFNQLDMGQIFHTIAED